MSRPIADQHDRERALDTTLSCIVQAPAGSGKTELLSQRFLALLAQADSPESILAITFTRKAASEMRLRIISALEAAQGPAPEEAHKLKTWQLAKAALHNNQQRGWQLLQSPQRLKVVTIDSLNASLARQMPVLSRMGVMPGPVEDARPFYLEAARRTLAEMESNEWQHDLGILMLHLGNQTQRIQELLITMLARREQWLRHLFRQDTDNINRHGLEQALVQLVDDHLAKLHQHLPVNFIQTICELAVYAAGNIEPGKNPGIEIWQQMEETTLQANASHLLAWQGLADMLLTQTGTVRGRIDKNTGFPAPSSTKDPQQKELWGLRKEQMQSLIDEIGEDPLALELMTRLRVMPDTRYSDNQWQLLDALTRILIMSATQLLVVFSEQGKVDFSEVASSAIKALGTDEEPTDLAMIMDYRLQHILVDEFQDTSNGQRQLLQSLTRGWQADDGRTLFLVGDPMQSIYRFREAEVGIYLNTRQHGIGDVQLTPLFLRVNFRSQQGIVDWVNKHLQQAFASEEDPGSGAVCYNESVPFHAADDAPAVRLYPGLGSNYQQEARQVCELVRQELAASDGSTIAILVRSRNQLADIILNLKQAAIAFQAVDLDPLREQAAVIDLDSLLRALLNPADRLHWLALLRSPCCGLELADLLVIASAASPLIWKNMLDESCREKLSIKGRQRLEFLLSRLRPFIENRGRLTLTQWLQRSWHALGGYAIYADRNSQEAMQRYLQLLEQYQQAGYLEDPAAFDEALDKLYAAPDRLAEGRLQIMTIHKSKGLEFDTVILPGMGRTARGDDKTLLQWLERPNSLGEIDLLLSPIKPFSEARSDSISNSLKAINDDKSRHELTRLLYVALTRAKKSLHLFAHASVSSKGKISASSNSLLNILWGSLADQFENLEVEESTSVDTAHSGELMLKRLPPDWQPTEAEALAVESVRPASEDNNKETPEFDWATDTARFVGTITHAWLEQLACLAKLPGLDEISAHRPAIRLQLQALGTDRLSLEQACDRVIEALTNTLQDKTGQWILSNHQQAQSEYELTYVESGDFHKAIIDRTFVDADGIRWIVDYKTGAHEGGDITSFLDNEQERYRPQLEKYARLLEQMESRPTRLGLYFPLMKAWRYWEYKTNQALA